MKGQFSAVMRKAMQDKCIHPFAIDENKPTVSNDYGKFWLLDIKKCLSIYRVREAKTNRVYFLIGDERTRQWIHQSESVESAFLYRDMVILAAKRPRRHKSTKRK